jgi:hypothetical protein
MVPTPTKIIEVTRGMTTIFKRLTNASPTGSMPVATFNNKEEPVIDATSPSKRPATRPSAMAVGSFITG